MVELKCSFEKCCSSIKQDNKDIAIALYRAHIATHTEPVANKGEDQGWGGRSQEEVKEDRGQAIKVLGNLDKGRFLEEAE